jgi:hypothetical protein
MNWKGFGVKWLWYPDSFLIGITEENHEKLSHDSLFRAEILIWSFRNNDNIWDIQLRKCSKQFHIYVL